MSDNTQGSAWDGVPVAWAAVAQNGQPLCLAYSRADARYRYHLAEVVPLYRSPTLTDAERELRRAVRALLDGVNARYPDKSPREWTCPLMAELDRLVPPEWKETGEQ